MTKKGIPEIYIQMGLNEISNEEYTDILKKILTSKQINEKDEFKRNHKLARYAIQKGFQPALVWKVINGEI
jgi:regulatory protein